MTGEFLITEAAQKMIGEPLGEPVQYRVFQKEIERYAFAVGDHNPIYFNAASAEAAGYAGTIAPPLYLEVFRYGAGPQADLREDGLSRMAQPEIPLKVNRVMAGGEEVEFFHPIHPDDIVTGVTRLHSLMEKTGRTGHFVLMVRETTYTNQHGVVVIKNRSSSVVR